MNSETKTETEAGNRAMYGIYRVTSPSGAWVVTLRPGKQRARKSKYFGFKSHGGEDSALAAAREYRDSELKFCRVRNKARIQKGCMRAHFPDELLNITRQHPDSKCLGWRVDVMFKGRKETRNFADSHYGGYEGALKAAQQHRDWLRSHLPRN